MEARVLKCEAHSETISDNLESRCMWENLVFYWIQESQRID